MTKHMTKMDYDRDFPLLDIFDNGVEPNVIFEKTTGIGQVVRITEHEGVRSLYLDGDLQFDDYNEVAVHNAFVEPLAGYTDITQKDILIIGGGDGGMARTLLNDYNTRSITQVEIDNEMPEICTEYFPKLNNNGDVFNQINLKHTDGLAYVHEAAHIGMVIKGMTFKPKYNTVILDLTIPYKDDNGDIMTGAFFDDLAVIADHVSFFISYRAVEQFDFNIFSSFDSYNAKEFYIPRYYNNKIIFVAGSFKSWTEDRSNNHISNDVYQHKYNVEEFLGD